MPGPMTDEKREAIRAGNVQHQLAYREGQAMLIRRWMDNGDLAEAFDKQLIEIEERIAEGKRPTSDQKHFMNYMIHFVRASD